jgi:hypothetical protein
MATGLAYLAFAIVMIACIWFIADAFDEGELFRLVSGALQLASQIGKPARVITSNILALLPSLEIPGEAFLAQSFVMPLNYRKRIGVAVALAWHRRTDPDRESDRESMPI